MWSLTSQRPSSLQELIEDVERTLNLATSDDSAFLQQVPINSCACDAAIVGETDPDELSEPRGIIISGCLSISERLQDGIRLEDLVREGVGSD